MIIPELDGKEGDAAIYFQQNGLYICKLKCWKDGEWYVEFMSGNWEVSNDGRQIISGKLTLTTAKWKEGDDE